MGKLKQSNTMLRLNRIMKGWSQYEVAKYIGCTQSKVSLIENGFAKPTKEEAQRLNSLFKFPLFKE